MVDVASDSNCYGLLKDSGVESLGVIPQHWKTSRFRNLFSFDKGLNITKDNLQDTGIPCINYGEVHSRFGFEISPDNHTLKCVHEEFLKNNPNSLLRIGDFIFADTSEDIDGSGNFSQLTGGELVFAGYHTIIARPINRCAKRFLAYMLDSVAFRDQVRRAVKGVKVYSITKSILKETSVWLPPTAEQELISDYLDRKLVNANHAIQIKERQIERLKERKQILIQKAVTRGINPLAPMRNSGIEWIGEIPTHWETVRLKYLFKEINERSKTGEETLLSLRMELGLVPHDDVSDKAISNESLVDYKIVRPGQMVMNRMRAAIGIFGVSSRLGLVSPDYAIFDIKERANPSFFLRLFKLPLLGTQFRLGSKGLGTGSSGFMRLYTQDFGDIKVAVPPLGEQLEILQFIDSTSERIDNACTLFEQQITRLKEYKATLINSAVTGKIKVPGVVEPDSGKCLPPLAG
ncbi:restriction endonuclease subunit S [Pseudomonas sp.]|uniref:restriction endonuclease subunit S n=1 Tax=Pseudomonas sp. TaxID=306 RepID=UPI00289794DA|nr:restriction endonuclease subunit S [Pseudomonas sp.]